MATPSIRMNDELKARLTVAAARAGKTAHAFVLDAITQAVEQAEQDHAFYALGQERWQAIQATGQTVPRASGNRRGLPFPSAFWNIKM